MHSMHLVTSPSLLLRLGSAGHLWMQSSSLPFMALVMSATSQQCPKVLDATALSFRVLEQISLFFLAFGDAKFGMGLLHECALVRVYML